MGRISHQGSGSLVIDREAHEVSMDGQPVHLTNAEYTLLTTLANSPRRAFSSEHLTQVLTNSEWITETHCLHVTVSRQRRKLGESGTQPRRIVTVHGYGYRFEPEAAPDLAEAMGVNAQPSSLDLSMLRAFALVGLDRSILWASDSFTQLLGWHPRDLQGTSIYELMHPGDQPNAMAVREELNKGFPVAAFGHLRDTAGCYRLFEVLVRPIIGPDGATMSFLGEYRPATSDMLPTPESIRLMSRSPDAVR